MAWPPWLVRLLYPRRRTHTGEHPSAEEVDAWVEIVEDPYFQARDEAFVNRVLGLGVTTGMMLDLDSRLGLVPLKVLWHEEGLLAMGVYGSLDVAERARETAESWGLGERMFFQVGDPRDLKFKTGYFDIVISDSALETASRPLELLREVSRVTKPGGGILLAQHPRPTRFSMGRRLSAGRRRYPAVLSERFESTLRAGYIVSELEELVAMAGLERTGIVAEGEQLFIERRGSNDPTSWVSERERYL